MRAAARRRSGAMRASSLVGRPIMVFRLIKYGVLTLAAGALVVSLLFGGEALSYVRTSGKSMRQSLNDRIPVEFQLRRARDLLGDILPEMQANVRVIAQQEVEIEAA